MSGIALGRFDIGEDGPVGAYFFRDPWGEDDDRDFVLEALKSRMEVRPR